MLAKRLSTKALVLALLLPLYVLAEPSLPQGIMKLDGRDAPQLALNNMDGKAYDIRNFRGRWVFVHFWASWCGPCRREMPLINELVPKINHKQMEFMLVNTAESEDTVFSFIATVAPGLNILLDTDGQATERWQPRGLPASFLVDPTGKLRYLALGGRPWNEPAYHNFINTLIRQ